MVEEHVRLRLRCEYGHQAGKDRHLENQRQLTSLKALHLHVVNSKAHARSL